jgi:DNA-binding NtrC family response regulator
MTPRRILIVEDEHAIGSALATAVRRIGLIPELAATAKAGLQAAQSGTWDAILLDIGLPDLSGLEVLSRLRARDPHLPILVITAHATLDHAITAQKSGATLYLTKPLDLRQLESALHSLLETRADPPSTVAPVPPEIPHTATLIGGAPCLQPVFIGIARACASSVPTLLTGPTGSGKSLAARIIHAHRTPPGPLSHVDSRQIDTPETLMRHLATVSASGTLLLDDIDLLPPTVQQALASHLADPPASSPASLLLATTRSQITPENPHAALVPALFYAFSASTLQLPPLSDRSGDIPALSAFFLALRGSQAVLTTPAVLALQTYPWPGNVRELRHILDYALALSGGDRILLSHLPPHLAGHTPSPQLPPVTTELDAVLHRWLDASPGTPYETLLDALETSLLRRLLDRHQGKVTHLANETRLNRATLRQKLRRLGLYREDTASET